MVSYEQAGVMLDALMDELPQGIFDRLNGGVNLIEEARPDEGGGYILGLYHCNQMGRYIEIFYGSFTALYGDIPRMQFQRRLRSTLHHELTHHVEAMAGDRSLERWDEEQQLLWQELDGLPPDLESIIFIDDDDCSLAPAAREFFSRKCPGTRCASAGLFAAGETLDPGCAAAMSLGADISAHEPQLLSRELFDGHTAAVCMTLAQTDELFDRWPGCESKVICLGEADIFRPRLKIGWKKTLQRLLEAADELAQLAQPEKTEEPKGTEGDIIRLAPDSPGELLDDIARLERENFSAPWSREMLERAIGSDRNIFLACVSDGRVRGYIGGLLVIDELEIYNLAVEPTARRRGLGRELTQRLFAQAAAAGARRISLEVRQGNAPAIALYEALGFEIAGRRKNYYEKPREDALIMQREL